MTPPEPEEEPERSRVEVEESDPEQQQQEPTVSEPPDADSKELDFLKLLQKNTMKKGGSPCIWSKRRHNKGERWGLSHCK